MFLAIGLLVSGTAIAGQGATATGSQSQSPESGMSEGQGKTVEGELVAIDGEFYVVKSQEGTEERLHVSPTTQKSEELKQGDMITAQVTDQGHALSIQAAEEAGISAQSSEKAGNNMDEMEMP
ncbi:MAG: hypothetical protein NPIRA04_34190 [Nitrospirales bacterium]|nr:MAG: hypothetical protein NPIRA04_34190 [Nitrospirales bacterium]